MRCENHVKCIHDHNDCQWCALCGFYVTEKRPTITIPTAELAALRVKAEAYDEAHRYALNLVTAMARDFPAVPEWQPLEDVTGMLMQIDNMGAGRSAKAEAEERDTARLDFIISESNEGRGWLEDSVWDVASNECEGSLDDTPAGYVRAHIDDQMKKSAVKEPNAE